MAALGYLAMNNTANQEAIVAAGGIAPLVALAEDGTPDAREIAAFALSCLKANATNLEAIGAALTKDGTPALRARQGGCVDSNIAAGRPSNEATARLGGGVRRRHDEGG